MKTCLCCGVSKELSEYSKHKQKKDGLYTYCKACKKEHDHISYLKYAPERYKSSRAWKKANPEKDRSYKKKWQDDNPEVVAAWRKANPDKIKGYAAETRKKFKAERLADVRKRQAQKQNATPSWANDEEIKYFYRLAKYFTDLSGGFVKYHVDHVVPLRGKNVCGLHVEHNLQVLPAHLNHAKGNKHES